MLYLDLYNNIFPKYIIYRNFNTSFFFFKGPFHFQNCTAKKGILILTSKSDGSILNLTALNFNSTFGPLMSFSEIETQFVLITIKVLYSIDNTPRISLFQLSNSIMTISDVYIPFFEGNTIFSIQMNSVVKLSNLNILNVVSQTNNRGCLFEFYSNSKIQLSNSQFTNFCSNTSMIFSLMVKIFFTNLHFKNLDKCNTPSDSQETVGIMVQSCDLKFEDSTIIEYTFEFLYGQSSNIEIYNCYFTNIYYSNIIYYWGTALELALCSSVNISNSVFINLTRSDEGSVIYFFQCFKLKI